MRYPLATKGVFFGSWVAINIYVYTYLEDADDASTVETGLNQEHSLITLVQLYNQNET